MIRPSNFRHGIDLVDDAMLRSLFIKLQFFMENLGNAWIFIELAFLLGSISLSVKCIGYSRYNLPFIITMETQQIFNYGVRP